jgi:uncharacterized protein with PIN domain
MLDAHLSSWTSSAQAAATARPQGELFVAPAERIRFVSDAASVAAFASSVRAALAAAADGADAWTVAVDAEWKPDLMAGSSNPPTLLQLASAETIWLICLQSLLVPCAPDASDAPADAPLPSGAELELVDSLALVLGSPHAQLIGFGFETDLSKLHGAYGGRHGCFAHATHVIDLKDACALGAEAEASESGGGGARRVVARAAGSLAVQLHRWAGLRLDKTEQCSDWSQRPLTSAQLAYAAADAACLLALADAVRDKSPTHVLLPRDFQAAAGRRRLRGVPSSGADETAPVAAERDSAAPDSRVDGADAATANLGVARAAVAAANLVGARCWLRPADEVAAAVALADEAAGGPAHSGWEELNSICFVIQRLPTTDSVAQSARDVARGSAVARLCRAPPVEELVLVLVPAAERVDLRWLSSALGVPRRCVRLATAAECVSKFGASAGTVPPLPLRPGVRVFAHAALRRRADEEAEADDDQRAALSGDDGGWPPAAAGPATQRARRRLWASSGAPDVLLVLEHAELTLGALCAAALAAQPAQPAAATPLAWLPAASLGQFNLDAAILGCRSFYAASPAPYALARSMAGPQYSAGRAGSRPSGAPPPPLSGAAEAQRRPLVVTVDCSLSKLARMLRLVGVDAAVAGESVRLDLSGCRGLARVKVDASLAEADFRRAAVQGRVLLCGKARRASSEALLGTTYRLLATEAEAQFAELLEVFGLRDAVDAGESRCGICNADNWRHLQPSEVVGRVPVGVLAETSEYFQCGSCEQIFWPGPKYEETMGSLKAAVETQTIGGGGQPSLPAASEVSAEGLRLLNIGASEGAPLS